MDKKKILALDALVFAALLAFDQWTKLLVIRYLKDRSAKVLLQGVLELQYLENRGSAFGMFQGQKLFIVTVDVLFMLILCWIVARIPQEKKFIKLHCLLMMVAAGVIGNLIDRMRFDYVVDFISFVLIHYPIFNVADIYIVIAVIVLFLLFVFVYREEDLKFLSLGRG